MTTFTLVHVVLSLVGIGSGFIVVFGLVAASHSSSGWKNPQLRVPYGLRAIR